MKRFWLGKGKFGAMGGVEERVAGKRPSQEITRDGDGGLWSGVGGKIGKVA
jgi:hypothetical protein